MADKENMKLLNTDKIKKYCSIMEQSFPLSHSPRTADEFPGVGMQLQFWNTIFLPAPEDISQPARQADMYDKPLFPHTGSHTLVGQLQSMLQSARKFFTCKF